MSAPPYMQMYWSDYFGDTRHLSCEQHGAYLQLLGAMWLSEGSLPDDPKKLARLTSCTASRWSKIGDDVLALFEREGGRITHRRISLELEKAQEKSIKRAEAGSRGGTAKALKDKKPDVAIATVLPQHLPEPEPEIGSEAKASSPSRKSPATPKSKRCPIEWLPSLADMDRAAAEGFSPGEIERELAKMRDHQFRDAHADWGAVFRNWIRNAKDRRAKHEPAGQPSAKLIARHENYRRAFAGAQDALDRRTV